MKSAQTNFASAELELVIHATEDMQKILSTVESVIGIKPEEFAVGSIGGYFGNEIKLLKASLGGEHATDLAYEIAKRMSGADREHMRDNFDLYLDEKNSLHVRISKQALFEGRIVLSQADSLKIRFKTVKRFRPENEMENYRKFLVQGDEA
ncbi:MAG: RNA-binding domain-containing protein [Nitrososphaerales archaeon]